jgi:hypothetical protein
VEVQEYLIEPNAKQAAIRAGYSAKTAAEIGHQNLRKLHVAILIVQEDPLHPDVDLFSDGRLRLGVGVGWNWVEVQEYNQRCHGRLRLGKPSALQR